VARLYLFADESGNFDFRDHEQHRGPTRYFAVGTAMIEGDDAVRALEADLLELKRTMAWNGIVHNDFFHASEDPQAVRDAVFEVIDRHPVVIDVTLVEKAKTQPHLRVTEERFYQYAWWFHFKYMAPRYIEPADELLVVAATLGAKKRRAAFRSAVTSVVNQCTNVQVVRRIGFWPVESHPCLQVADYGTWAVTRAWETGDQRALNQVKSKVRSQYDYTSWGSTYYYGSNAIPLKKIISVQSKTPVS
jgi:hypothetical protein